MADLTWTVAGITERLAEDVPVIVGGLLGAQADDTDPRWAWAERALAHVHRLCGGDPERLEAAVDAFAVTSFDFLRLQARFKKTGRYACDAAGDLLDLYGDAERMVEYLDGLALSYAMWPNHASMVGFYLDEFVDRLPPAPRILEIGPGHGLLAALLLERRPEAEFVGVDISASSLDYTRRSLENAGADMGRVRLIEADATSATFADMVGVGALDGIVCCEVLEHVDRPESILSGVSGVAGPQTRIFLSTVANLEALDHVFLFHDLEHIRATVDAAGFRPLVEQPLVLPGAEDERPIPLNYSAVVSRR